MPTTIRIALIDLYDGIENEGLRAISESVESLMCAHPEIDFVFDRFDTRRTSEIPGLDYDLYISSGGPGSPFDGEGTSWYSGYKNWIQSVYDHNLDVSKSDTARNDTARNDTARKDEPKEKRKHVLFICHSFQLMCLHFKLASITKRHSPSFGILKVHQTADGQEDPLFAGLPDPFYAGDFRSFQAVSPNSQRLSELGAVIIASEKKRPHVKRERAVMGIRITDEMVGVQFHPEADPEGMRIHFNKPNRKREITDKYSLEKYNQVMDRLDDPDFLEKTHTTILPNFFEAALRSLVPQHSEPSPVS